jgi:hypothetical protein
MFNMKEYEQCYNKISEAIKLDASNPKFYRIAGVTLITVAKNNQSIDFARLALDNFCSANELQPENLNHRNYMNSRKFVYLLNDQINYQNKIYLLGYLEKLGFETEEIANYLKKSNGENKKIVPKEFQCAISLVG